MASADGGVGRELPDTVAVMQRERPQLATAFSTPHHCRRVDDNKLQHAKALGADDMVNNRNASEAAEHIQEITGPGELAWSSIALGCNRRWISAPSCLVETARGRSSGWAAATMTSATEARRMERR
jgi:hypothetical protein